MITMVWGKLARHKFIVFCAVALVSAGGYFGYTQLYGNSAETRYVLAGVEKGTLIVSVSGSGQVATSNQVDIKAKAGGEAVYVGAKNGQNVKAGALLAQLDAREAQKSVRDAEASLESAKLSLEKLQQPADQLSILQSEHSLAQANESKQNAHDDLIKAYEDGFNAVANAFLALPSVITGIDSMFFDNTIDRSQLNTDWYANQIITYDSLQNEKVMQYKSDVAHAYLAARKKYDENFAHYKTASRNSDPATIESLIMETYETTKVIAEATKTSDNYISYIKDSMEQNHLVIPAIINTNQTALNTYTGTTNTHLSSLLTIKRTIENAKATIINAERSIAEKTESLAQLKAGADPLDVRAQELSITQRENALSDAQEKLDDYFIRAPFDGIIAQIATKKGDDVSSGAAVATLIAHQRIAEIALNEVDAAKVKIGQKATLTFDALEGLSITGGVAEIDALGTVSQGVVTYDVQIGFDTQDERVKPGMSASATVITEVKQEVLMVPNAAVKLSEDAYYVDMLNEAISPQALTDPAGVISQTSPRRQTVVVGLANDTMTEIVSGLHEGDAVITRTIAPSTATQTTQQGSLFSIPGSSTTGTSRTGSSAR